MMLAGKLEQSWPASFVGCIKAKAECCWGINRQNKIYWGTTTETFHHLYLSDLQQEFFVLNWVLLVASPERRHWFTNSWKSNGWDSKIDTKYTWMDFTLGWTWPRSVLLNIQLNIFSNLNDAGIWLGENCHMTWNSQSKWSNYRMSEDELSRSNLKKICWVWRIIIWQSLSLARSALSACSWEGEKVQKNSKSTSMQI